MTLEVLSLPFDGVSALPRHAKGRATGAPPKPPALWSASPAVWGAYPKDFVRWASRAMGVREEHIVHVCSGGLGRVGRCSIDMRREASPHVVADGRRLPLVDGCAHGVMLDPPYSVEYAAGLYGTDYPRPSHLLAEAARVTRPGGVIGMLHFLVASPPVGARIERVYGVTTGVGYRIRAFTLYRREHARLL